MTAVVTLTPSAAVDRTYRLGQLHRGRVNRASAVHSELSGKGVNVAAALAAAGTRVSAVLAIGEGVGRWIGGGGLCRRSAPPVSTSPLPKIRASQSSTKLPPRPHPPLGCRLLNARSVKLNGFRQTGWSLPGHCRETRRPAPLSRSRSFLPRPSRSARGLLLTPPMRHSVTSVVT